MIHLTESEKQEAIQKFVEATKADMVKVEADRIKAEKEKAVAKLIEDNKEALTEIAKAELKTKLDSEEFVAGCITVLAILGLVIFLLVLSVGVMADRFGWEWWGWFIG